MFNFFILLIGPFIIELKIKFAYFCPLLSKSSNITNFLNIFLYCLILFFEIAIVSKINVSALVFFNSLNSFLFEIFFTSILFFLRKLNPFLSSLINTLKL